MWASRPWVDETAVEPCIQEIIAITRRMRALADDGAWDSLTGLERERRSLIHSCFGPSFTFDDPASVADAIRRILEEDEAIVQRVAKARDKLSGTLDKVRQGRVAARAYHACERQQG